MANPNAPAEDPAHAVPDVAQAVPTDQDVFTAARNARGHLGSRGVAELLRAFGVRYPQQIPPDRRAEFIARCAPPVAAPPQTSLAPAAGVQPVANPLRFTIFSRDGGPLTKRIGRDANGSLEITSDAQLSRGAYRTETIARLSELTTIITALESNEALAWGIPKDGRPSGVVATASTIKAGRAPKGAIARTREHMAWSDGPAVWMLDIDLKGVPDAQRPNSLDEVRTRLIHAVPALAAVPTVALPSASSQIFDARTGACVRGLTGMRVYVAVARGTEIPELGARLRDRLVLSGDGFAFIAASGLVHVRTPVDTATWRPEGLDFIGGALCTDGLEQRRDEPQIWNPDGAPLRLDQLPPLSEGEKQQVAAIEAQLREAARPEAMVRRTQFVEAQRAKGRAVSASWRPDGTIEYLEGEHEIQLEDGTWTPVDRILSEPERYHAQHCADPLEPEYGNCDRRIAQIYLLEQRTGPAIHSHAHGGMVYMLRPSAQSEFDVAQSEPTDNGDDAPPSARVALTAFNQEWALVEDVAGAALHTPPCGPVKIIKLSHARDLCRNRTVVIDRGGKPRTVQLFDLWLAWSRRRTYRRLVNDPSLQPRAGVPCPYGGEDYNLWCGFALAPALTGSCNVFLAHLRDVVCREDAEVYRWVLMWLAAMVQRPDRLPGTALVLRGAQGAGKSIVGDIMRTILGDSLAIVVSRPDELTGRFNSLHEGRLLIQVEEAFFAGDKTNVGRLKHMITAHTVRIERKGLEPYELPNFARMLVTSNEAWVVPAGLGERRFMVLDVDSARANDLAYFGALRRQMLEEGGCARLLQYLVHEVVIDWDQIARPLATEALRDQQIASLDPERRWLLDILTDGALPGDDTGEGVAPADALFTQYERFVRDHGGRRASRETLGKLLAPYGVERRRYRTSGERPYCYVFPLLSECRERFARDLAAAPEWDDAAGWGSTPLFSGGVQ